MFSDSPRRYPLTLTAITAITAETLDETTSGILELTRHSTLTPSKARCSRAVPLISMGIAAGLTTMFPEPWIWSQRDHIHPRAYLQYP